MTSDLNLTDAVNIHYVFCKNVWGFYISCQIPAANKQFPVTH